jgi:L-alanine-DL-glutamate epimerase-like enolase superfamily enzyme
MMKNLSSIAASNSLAGPLFIKRVDAIPVSLPLIKPMFMAGVRIEAAQNLLVRVEAHNGMVGWGEAASAPLMTGDVQDGMLAVVDQVLKPLLIGKNALEHARLARDCHAAIHGSGGPKSAVDTALLDLCGHYLNVPVADLLGGALRNELRPMFLLGNANNDDNLSEAIEKTRQGIFFFKLKVGVKPVKEEIRFTLQLREELGPLVILCADANTGYSMSAAKEYLAGVAGAGLLFFEQPLPSNDIRGMALLARSTEIPLCADEAITETKDILDYHAAGAASGINLKTIKIGGMGEAVRAANLCEALGMQINLACKVAESTIGAAALVQLGAVINNLDWGISVTNHYLAADLAPDPIKAVEGAIAITRKPGLGIEVSDAEVNRFRTR